MNIIYKLHHLTREKSGNAPYLYIGSKYNWKGPGTYFSSSRHPIAKTALPEELELEVLWASKTCTVKELQEVEKQFQLEADVINNPLYFNQNIANSRMYSLEAQKKGTKKFIEKANSIDVYTGKKFSELWSSKRTIDNTVREKMRASGLVRMAQITASGVTVAKEIAKKTHATLAKKDEYGLSGYQQQGKKLSKWLNTIDPSTGKTIGQLRNEKNRGQEITVLGITFSTVKSAEEYFDFRGGRNKPFDDIASGLITQRLYNKLLKKISKSTLDCYVQVKKAAYADGFIIEEFSFPSVDAAIQALKISEWSAYRFKKEGHMTSSLRAALNVYRRIQTICK